MKDSSENFDLNKTLGFNLNRLSILFRRNLIRALKEYQLQPEHWQVLASLHGQKKPISQGELAKVTLKDKHALSKMLVRMENSGWILRENHPEDTRIKLVVMSQKAEAEFECIRDNLHAHFRTMMEGFGRKNHDELLQLILKLLAFVEEE
ncbi:MAG: MarR family transcriptional regulator [SAR324 cluster bacterium]|nr:MarR family transcriptional regulator [SAR324 cluster bacterium]